MIPRIFIGVCMVVLISGVAHAAAPTGITLSSNTIKENSPEGTLLCTMTAVDADPGDSHAFTLAKGIGDEDNTDFRISGNQLILNYDIPGDYEVVGPEEFTMRLRVTDSTGLIFEQIFIIYLADDLQEDNDGDGFTQEQEIALGTSDAKFDTDGDGIGDAVEVTAGTSPTNANIWPANALTVGWGKADKGEQSMPWTEDIIAMSTGQNHSLALTAAGTLHAWGGTGAYGQKLPPTGLSDMVALAAGGNYWPEESGHSLALKSDGTVTAWGYDMDGLLAVPPGLNQVAAIDSGRFHHIALLTNGTVRVWGSNPFGTIEPPSILEDVIEISACGFQNMALRDNGTVTAWGSYFDGLKWIDTTVPVGLADVVAVSAGRFHCLALKADGTVTAWGNNSHGQINVPPGLTGVIAVAAGGFHSLALKNDGSVVAWGLNSHGQATVPNAALAGIKMISAGVLHSLAARLGPSSPAITSSPQILSSPGTPVAHQIVVTNPGGTVVYSAKGLPDGLTINPANGLISGIVESPARRSVKIEARIGLRTLTQSAWVGISSGLPPTSIILTPPTLTENSPADTFVGTLSAADPNSGDSSTFEWVDGAGSVDNFRFRLAGNQLFLNETLTRDYETNSANFSIRLRVRDASLNPLEQIVPLQFIDDRTEDTDGDGITQQQEEDIYFTSDLTYDSDGDGFGDGYEVAYGSLPKDASNLPTGRLIVAWGNHSNARTTPPPGLQNIIDLSAGGLHSLALRSDGTVTAWGSNDDLQVTVPEELQQVIAVEAGELHSLALKRDGTVTAWGNNVANQTAVPLGLSGVVAISAGAYHNLALKNNGSVTAWGFDESHQSSVPAGLSGVVAVSAGGYHSLALKDNGTVVAWGSDWSDANVVPAGLDRVTAIAAGGFHSLALRFDGTVVAWGNDAQGQTDVPPGLNNVTAISAGWRHSIALKADGTLVSWGADGYRQTRLPLEAIHIRKIEAGSEHNLAIRQISGFPCFADVSPIKGWPGDTIARSNTVLDATPVATNPFSSMGLPAALSLHSATGLISGTVILGERKSVRISADTNQGMISHVFWFDTVDGVAPTSISLSGNIVAENSPANTFVGVLTVADPNKGDTHTFELPYVVEAPYNYLFQIVGNQLAVRFPVTVNYNAGIHQITIRVVAVDSGNNRFEQNIVLQLTDDRSEDSDGDGISQATEEDTFGTSDSTYDELSESDVDHDGIPGIIEYAFNSNPKIPGPLLHLIPGAASTAGLPATEMVETSPNQFRLRMEYLRRVGNGMIYTPQFGSGIGPAEWTTTPAPTVTSINSSWERCVVQDTFSTSTAARRFGRIGVRYVGGDRPSDLDGDGITQAMEEDVFGTSDSSYNDFRTEDLDHDGIPGIIEYAFNLQPKYAGPHVWLTPGAGSIAGLPAISIINNRLRIEYVRRVGSILNYTPQFTGTLNSGAWQTVTPLTTTAIGENWERCIAEDPQPASAGARFARVAVSW